MKKDDAYDSDSCDEDYTGQPPDGDQSFIVPRRGLEPDSGPDDDPMIVERRGSPADSDSLVFEEDMGEYGTIINRQSIEFTIDWSDRSNMRISSVSSL